MLAGLGRLSKADGDKSDGSKFGASVAGAMVTRLHTVASTASVDALLPIFERNEVAIVMDDEEFVGLITRVDLINHLRLQP